MLYRNQLVFTLGIKLNTNVLSGEIRYWCKCLRITDPCPFSEWKIRWNTAH